MFQGSILLDDKKNSKNFETLSISKIPGKELNLLCNYQKYLTSQRVYLTMTLPSQAKLKLQMFLLIISHQLLEKKQSHKHFFDFLKGRSQNSFL